MNPDHRDNIEETIRIVGEAIFVARSYIHLLEGLQAGASADNSRVKNHPLAVDMIYRAVFDALFSAIGTVLDQTRGTHSIPSLLKMLLKYQLLTGDIKTIVAEIYSELGNSKAGPIYKLESWRHKVVAHRTKEGQATEFYTNNKLNIDEVSNVLNNLEAMVNRISVPLLKTGYDWKPGSRCAKEAASLLTS